MSSKPKIVAYTRDPKTRNMVAPYESKFTELIKLIAQVDATGADVILIAEPWVIGDTYEEMVESLSRLGGTGLALEIAQRKSTLADN